MNKITFRGDTDDASSYVMIKCDNLCILDIDFRGFKAYHIGEIIGVDIL